MKIKNIPIIISLFIFSYTNAQIDSALIKRIDKDTIVSSLNMDAVYSRPFLKFNKTPISLGGYVEMNFQHIGTDGLSDGSEFQFRRLSLFVASSISERIKFLSEIEFENDKDEQLEGGSMEIEIEYAALDIEFHPLFNFRGGIILNPIGAFNQNHDGPKWEFTDRPISATQMLPATFSNSGFGFYGKQYSHNWYFGYEIYLTGGFDNTIIDNDLNKTYLPHANENTSRLVTSASGSPLITGKLSVRNNKIGEIGVSYMAGIYNKWQQDGAIIDNKRRTDIFAVDFNTTIPKINTNIITEFAWIFVQVPKNYFEQFGTKQQGGFIDIVQPLLKGNIFGWEKATLNLALRMEYVDWNIGTFKSTGENIGDDIWSFMPAISFRPTPQTVIRLNYRHQKQRDIAGNPPATTGGIIFGISSYF